MSKLKIATAFQVKKIVLVQRRMVKDCSAVSILWKSSLVHSKCVQHPACQSSPQTILQATHRQILLAWPHPCSIHSISMIIHHISGTNNWESCYLALFDYIHHFSSFLERNCTRLKLFCDFRHFSDSLISALYDRSPSLLGTIQQFSTLWNHFVQI